MEKTIIDAREVLQDIRSGIDDSALMEKYRLSAKGLQSLFDKLSNAGLIKQISPKTMIRDIRSGMSHDELMQKHKLSSGGLDRVLKDLQDFGLLCLPLQSKPNRTKITIVIPKIVNDLQAGMSELALMEKYDLSAAALRHAFDKLLKRGAIASDLLAHLSPEADDTAKIVGTRTHERRYPVLSLRVCQVDDRIGAGFVRDISESGVGISGLLASEGDVKDLLFRADDFLEVKPFIFRATCRWFKIQSPTARPLSGFEIIDIWEKSSRNLHDFIQLATVAFEDHPQNAA
jgi:uncharacterized protein (DUF433 family)